MPVAETLIHPGYLTENGTPYWETGDINTDTLITPGTLRRLSFITPEISVVYSQADFDNAGYYGQGSDRFRIARNWSPSRSSISQSVARRRGDEISPDQLSGGLVGLGATVGEVIDALNDANDNSKFDPRYPFNHISALGPAITIDLKTGAVNTNPNDLFEWGLPVHTFQEIQRASGKIRPDRLF